MPVGTRALAACAAVVAVAVTGCGDKAPGIPRSDASEMVGLLRMAQREADDPQKCDDLLSTVRELSAKVRDLPAATDSDVRDSLTNGVRNLADTARSQCAKTQTTPTTPDTTPTTPTVPPPTDTTPTEPPPTTDTTPTTPSQTTPPPPTQPGPAVPTTPGTGGAAPGNGAAGNGPKPKHPKKPGKPKEQGKPGGARGAGHGGRHG